MRRLPVLAALLWCSATFSDEATAQTRDYPEPVTRQASAGSVSAVVGFVTDEDGTGLHGASVLAMGATLAVVRTDTSGRFHLSLAPGAYILRAAHDGYISTYREAVQVRTDAPLTRNITLWRADAADVVLASAEQGALGASDDAAESARPVATPSDAVWRLRHLPRTALRDRAPGTFWQDDEMHADIADRVALASLLTTELKGHVDFLTTSALAASGDMSAVDWPRGVAYVVVGAPAGDHGDWSVRASLAGGERSAWTFAGEYTSHTDRPHVVRAGVSYSAQTLIEPGDRHSLAAIDTVRRVGGFHVSDQWAVYDALRVESKLQVARYDYLAEPTLVSGTIGVRQRVAPWVDVVATFASLDVAPGADQFEPPASTGVWLPPERTFSHLEAHEALRPQQVRYHEVGADATLRRDSFGDANLLLRVRRFSERTSDQIATLFGLDDASQVGHYYFSSPGGVDVDGWMLGVSSRLTPHVQASLSYSSTVADWRPSGSTRALRRASFAAARTGMEHLHDLTATVDANVPSTATRVIVAFRINSGFSPQHWGTPGTGGRFAVEVRQQLPVRPLGRGELNLLVSARTLLHQIQGAGGYYDELLTVAPPVRLTCGLQMRF